MGPVVCVTHTWRTGGSCDANKGPDLVIRDPVFFYYNSWWCVYSYTHLWFLWCAYGTRSCNKGPVMQIRDPWCIHTLGEPEVPVVCVTHTWWFFQIILGYQEPNLPRMGPVGVPSCKGGGVPYKGYLDKTLGHHKLIYFSYN